MIMVSLASGTMSSMAVMPVIALADKLPAVIVMPVLAKLL